MWYFKFTTEVNFIRGKRLKVTYENQKIERICTDARTAEKRYGRRMAEKIHQRIHILRIRYDGCIIFSLTLLSVGLAVCMGIMFQKMHLSGVPAVVDSYSSVLLRDGADLYVIIAVAAFVAGVIFTMVCIWFQNKKSDQKKKV